MKTDNYLTLCLEQAAKSPLHYRHGCIIVRGGKVIGQGHNDYRPGFDGGALKHGRVAGSALNGAALAEMKAKLKERNENKARTKDNQQPPPQPPRQPAAFEKVGAGGGVNANTPLSMHSEMMAIHSALSTSSNLACSSFSHDKPSFKLPRGDKKKERLRRDVLQNYVERICEVSTSTTAGQAGKLQVQECGFVRASSQRRRGTGSPQQQQRPPRGSGSAAAGRRGQGVSGSEEYGETTRSEREEESETSSRVRAVSVSQQRPFWESGTAKFFTATATTTWTTGVCV
jgi:tRNA(Arg) A34 adenosine deaminase TadA